MREPITIELDANARLEITFGDGVEIAKDRAEYLALQALSELMKMPGVESKRFKTAVVLVEDSPFALVAAADTERLEGKVHFVASVEAAQELNAKLAKEIGLDPVPGVPRLSGLPGNPFRQH